MREFRRQLDEGMWAGVPTTDPGSGRREALLVTDFAQIPDDAERVLFWPRAMGGARQPPPLTPERAVTGLGVILFVLALGRCWRWLSAARGSPGARAGGRAAPAGPWLREPPLSAGGGRGALARAPALGGEPRGVGDVRRARLHLRHRQARPARGRRAARRPPRYRYLIYPHLPVVALLPRSMAPVREYCVAVPGA